MNATPGQTSPGPKGPESPTERGNDSADLSVDRLIDEICASLRVEIEERSETGVLTFAGRGVILKSSLRELQDVAHALNAHPVRGVERWTDSEYEVLLALDTPLTRMRFRRDDLTLEDHQAGMTYQLGTPSSALAMGIILNLAPSRTRENALRIRRAGARFAWARRREEDIDALEEMSSIFRRFIALRIVSSEPRRVGYFRRCVNSFMFHVAYNLDLTLARAPSEGLFPEFNPQGPRQDESEIDVPRLSYDEELVSRYVAATASSDVVSRYLGYYHVLEGQFEGLYNDFLVGKVRNHITSPSFSIKRDRDVSSLVKSVARLVRERQNETAGIDENKALRLTLEKFVDIANVEHRLNSKEYVAHLAENEVSFSGGEKVDLSAESGSVLTSLANRIYKTRNAVVHAKETVESRYRPAVDAKELESETKLMRALAEEVIINKGEVLG